MAFMSIFGIALRTWQETPQWRHRPLTHFLAHIAPPVTTLAASLLDSETATSFLSYVNDELDRIPTPEEILGADDFEAVSKRLKEMVVKGKSIRLDILGALCTRLLLHLKKQGTSDTKVRNLMAFMKLDYLPNDLRAPMHMDILKDLKQLATVMAGDKELARMILK